jgi:hypothetical protein
MNDIPISILDSYELYTGSKRIHDAVSPALSTDNYAISLCLLILDGTKGMEKAMGKALKSGFTSLLFDSDKFRDDAFLGLRSYIRTYTFVADPAKRAAAMSLEFTLGTVGRNIHRLGYMDQTAKMNTLIENFSAEGAQQHLTTINGTEWFTEMVTAQKNFETVYQTKTSTESAIDLPLLKDSKRKITNALDPLLTYIETNEGLNPTVYKPLVAKLNEIITEITAIARARITRVENEKKEAAAKGK